MQEALAHEIEHDGARRAVVEIEEDHTTVRVSVRDDAAGFDPTTRTDGFGLIGMHGRAQLVGGAFKIRSAPGSGTSVRAELPAYHRITAQIA